MEGKEALFVIVGFLLLVGIVIWVLSKRAENKRQRDEETRKKEQAEKDAETLQAIAEKTSEYDGAMKVGAATGFMPIEVTETTSDPKEIKTRYGADDAADYLDVSSSNIYRWRSEGSFPKGRKERIGSKKQKQWTWTQAQLDKWDKENPRD